MNHHLEHRRSNFRGILACMAAIALGLCFLSSPPNLEAQFNPVKFTTVTNLPTQVDASFTTNLNTGLIPIRNNQGLALFHSISSTNASTAAVTVTYQGSYDGTNWSTTTSGVLTYITALNGTTGVVGYTNFPPAVLNNLKFIRVGTIQNAHNASLFLTNITYSYYNQ